MKKIKVQLNLKSKKINTIRFSCPKELLLCGMKMSYVTPEKVEEMILKTLLDEVDSNKRSDCLEEKLMSLHNESIEIDKDELLLNISWDNLDGNF